MAVKDKLKTDLFPTIWCPGCGIGLIMQQLASVMDELGLDETNTVIVTGIGCTGRMGAYMNFESVYTLHGRTLPVAEAIKTVRPGAERDRRLRRRRHGLDRRQPPAPRDPPQPEHHGPLQQQRDLRPDRRPDRPHHAAGHEDDLLAGRRHRTRRSTCRAWSTRTPTPSTRRRPSTTRDRCARRSRKPSSGRASRSSTSPASASRTTAGGSASAARTRCSRPTRPSYKAAPRDATHLEPQAARAS